MPALFQFLELRAEIKLLYMGEKIPTTQSSPPLLCVEVIPE